MAGRSASLGDRAVRQALRLGVRKGLGDGSRAWLVVGAGAIGFRLLQRMARAGKPVVVTEELGPGQTLVIRHLAGPE